MFALLAAIQFLTRIPIPLRVDYESKLLARSTSFFPFVGLFIGLIVAFAAYLSALIVPSYIVPVIVVGTWVVLTGALHLDGLLDTADGLLSHRSREQMLEIMKDSRIGAMGTIVALFYLLLKILFVFAILEQQSGWLAYLFLAVIPIYSRWTMTVAIVFWPYARTKNGLGSLYQAANIRHFVISSLMMLFCSLLPWLAVAQSVDFVINSWLLMVSVAVFVTVIFSSLCVRRLDGMTGDTYGALNELTELAILFTIVIAGRI
jgi:cobalamin 5'-phosphate synthase/cobalamin synthase